jgi:hypothetical protein
MKYTDLLALAAQDSAKRIKTIGQKTYQVIVIVMVTTAPVLFVVCTTLKFDL